MINNNHILVEKYILYATIENNILIFDSLGN
jgi:hypothetical protein